MILWHVHKFYYKTKTKYSKDIHTKHGSVGEPIINCHSLKYKKIDSSMSHEKNYAIAIVMIFW